MTPVSPNIRSPDAPGKKLRKIYYLIPFLILALLVFLLAGNNGLLRIWRTHREIQVLESELRKEQDKRREILREKEMLQYDDRYIEKIAREKLGMAGPGEEIYKFVPAEKETSDVQKKR